MMKYICSTVVSGIILLGGSMSAAAQGTKPDKFSKMDTNRDGRLTQSEISAAYTSRFYRIDTNRDGYISISEMRAHEEAKRAARRERRLQRKMKRLDTDGNGVISRSEYDARPKSRLQRMDTNRDGFITRAEYDAAKAKRRERNKRR